MKEENNKTCNYLESDRNFQENADTISEAAFQYAEKKDGEYTLEDYYNLPDERRVELIDGVFYDMAAPSIIHQVGGLDIFRQLSDYVESQNGSCLVLASPLDVQLDCDEWTMLQPDVVVICDWDKVQNRCIYGAPDLVIEILSPSTMRRDQTIKMNKYRNAGVREYWMIDLKQKRVIVYDFENQKPPVIYGMKEPVPVQIYGGDCRIRFDRMLDKINRLEL
ncbi:MAG: Uma2 family endonuclease [Lachnospiraceae bacterium]|nr:Uma2 family endonuclease [Lachnospiraceae bacterium]